MKKIEKAGYFATFLTIALGTFVASTTVVSADEIAGTNEKVEKNSNIKEQVEDIITPKQNCWPGSC